MLKVQYVRKMEKTSGHPYNSIRAWKYNYKFSLKFVFKKFVLEEIEMLDSSKAIQQKNIPVKTIKGNSDLRAKVICKLFTES